ncbi:MAG: helix-turn-helix domain-containing protein [Bacteroidales bacterium]|jgi:AraC-like DNA-binding protein|nr:helix-turn-helix domain-containing protein [Bacteroidales bacterium]
MYLIKGVDLSAINLLLNIPVGLVVLFFLIRLSRNFGRYIPLTIFVAITIIELAIQALTQYYLKDFSSLLYITEPFSMLYGMLIYMYARNQSERKFILRKTDILLIVPFVIAILSYLPYYILQPTEKLVDFKQYGTLVSDISENIWEWNFEIVLNTAFLIAALNELKKYNSKIKEQLSDIQKTDLHLTQLLIKVSFITYFAEFIVVYMTLYGFEHYKILFQIFYLLYSATILLIGYDAITSNKYINQLIDAWGSKKTDDKQAVKYAKSTLTDTQAEEISKKLTECMDNEKPYLKPQLRIKDMESITGVNSHQISQVINDVFNKNFYEFVNAYRVNEAIRILNNRKYINYTYSAIGFEAGFNSKSAFYNSFKRETGKTPAQYRSENIMHNQIN